jgi:translocator protein
VTIGRTRRWPPIVIAAAVAAAVAGLGALNTDLSGWYYRLRKPDWEPPDWLFGPVWTLIFALAAIAGVSAWRNADDPASRTKILGLFAVNGFLNVFWSALFFRFHRPDWALAEVGFLWLSVLVLIVALVSHSRVASWILVPYLLWVGFAALLNLAVVRLNGPFGIQP